MIDFEQYPFEFESLPIECIIFFSKLNLLENGKNNAKTIREFCTYYQEKYNITEAPQPHFVAKICDKLCDNNSLTVFNKGGFNNIDNSYFCLIDTEIYENDQKLFDLLNTNLSCLIYGFKYVYNYYKDYVLPIIHVDKNEDLSIGSSFLYRGGILTAKHCIEDAKKISIKGIDSEQLKEAKFFIHENEKMDLVYIKLSNEITNSIYFESEATILDEVIALGFPQIPGFHNFLTAEKAVISARFTTTVGQVASIAEDIWMRENLILITAKIRGGNSGGPIINEQGMIVGVASNIPDGEGKYDDLGYGTVIPIKFAKDILGSLSAELDVADIEFTNFTN